MAPELRVVMVPPARAGEAAEVLADAFHDYPVLRFVIGAAGAAYDARLRRFTAFAVAARHLRGELVSGVEDRAGRLVGVATIVGPEPVAAPPALDPVRADLWTVLGDAALARYERHGAAVGQPVAAPHYHLSMIGVRRAARGGGAGGLLLRALHARALVDPRSTGVGLNTQDPANVPFYERFGYQVVAAGRVADAYQSWSFFRPDATAP